MPSAAAGFTLVEGSRSAPVMRVGREGTTWRAPFQSAARAWLGAVAQVWSIGRWGYRPPAPLTTAAAAKPEPFTVIVLLALAPAMRYPPSFTQEPQHVALPPPSF
jgi:hypothetical protein